MIKPDGSSRQNRIYGYKYQQARKRLLATRPLCHWCKVNPATTADHEPPVHLAGPHSNLVPACRKCNFGRCNPKDLGKEADFARPYMKPDGDYPGPSRIW